MGKEVGDRIELGGVSGRGTGKAELRVEVKEWVEEATGWAQGLPQGEQREKEGTKPFFSAGGDQFPGSAGTHFTVGGEE